MMRKYTCLLLFALLLNGCDDGDITVNNIDFDDVAEAQNCTDENLIVYKLKTQEALILQVPENTFENNPTGDGEDPDRFSIDNTSYRLVYRGYDGTIAGTYICSLIPPTSPKVIDEWYAKSGVIEITTTQTVSAPDANNATKINGYNHNIIVKNVTYSVSGVDVTVPQIVFGNFKTTIASTDQLNLVFKAAADQCGDDLTGQVFNFNSSSSITIDAIDPSLIVNSVTPLNAPRTGLLGTTSNKLLYRVYQGGVVDETFFCKATTPTTPTLKETWTGADGVKNADGTFISGIIEVTTTTFAAGFKHTILLKKVTLQKGNNKFLLGDSFLLGEIITTPPTQ